MRQEKWSDPSDPTPTAHMADLDARDAVRENNEAALRTCLLASASEFRTRYWLDIALTSVAHHRLFSLVY